MDQNDYPVSKKPRGVWIEDGILYAEYINEISLEEILENEKKSIHLINEHKIRCIPLVVLFRNIGKTEFKLSISDFGKTLATFNLFNRTSGIWVVGAEEELKQVISMASRIFVANRIKFADTLDEAKAAAMLLRSSSTSILEKDS